jgi:5-formyltetrahydrofolate cyclo-ligase
MVDINPEKLAAAIESLPQFAAARTVALYHALPDEVPTADLLARWLGVKRLALPVIVKAISVGATTVMFFREYTGPQNLATGPFGIMEPSPTSAAPLSSRTTREVERRDLLIPPSEIDLMLVPGVAFDRSGRRLGRGGGFYDRYLAAPDAAHIYKVGLAHPHSIVPNVPTEQHDITMDIVVFN